MWTKTDLFCHHKVFHFVPYHDSVTAWSLAQVDTYLLNLLD